MTCKVLSQALEHVRLSHAELQLILDLALQGSNAGRLAEDWHEVQK